MKKFHFIMQKIIIFLVICTSTSYGSNIVEGKNINIIINSRKVDFSASPIIYNDHILVPARNIFNFFNISNENITYSNNSISIKRYSSILTLNIKSNNAYIDGNKIHLNVPPIIHENITYLPIRIISEFLDCQVYYDNNSKSIFIKDLNEYQQIESFFEKIEDKLLNVKNVQMDIINEIKNNKGSYSFGNSIYLDRSSNKIYQKNMLDSEWTENKLTLTTLKDTSKNTFNTAFFTGISFDRNMSDENFMVFKGYYPAKDGTLCKTTLYVNPTTLYIVKQISEFNITDSKIIQNILYTYN